MPPPLPYFKVNICPFPLPLNIFRLFVILSLTQLYRYTPGIFLFMTAIFKYTYCVCQCCFFLYVHDVQSYWLLVNVASFISFHNSNIDCVCGYCLVVCVWFVDLLHNSHIDCVCPSSLINRSLCLSSLQSYWLCWWIMFIFVNQPFIKVILTVRGNDVFLRISK